ncbi:MAG: divergent polysaccharide deacetylase family protein, partial [Treponema sp.]|nr:divergent polysaccharide deacetylase family protein [Treponema sp.]
MARSRVEKPRRPRKPRKKLAFEDAVRAALVAAAVVCAAVLGAGGFFAVRSVLASPFTPPAAAETDEPVPPPAVPPYPEDAGEKTDILPELEEALRRLDSGTPAAPPVMPSERKGVLVFVIDDAGNNLRELEPFLAFPGPLTIAVLP